jgi:tRNA threonylcarbamoyl adenosine modification protein YeaZ
MSHREDSSKKAPLPTGLLLALDTAGEEGSVALGRRMELAVAPPRVGVDGPDPDGEKPSDSDPPESISTLEVLGQSTLKAEEEHASLLVPRIRALLEEEGVGPEQLAGVVVGAGPGSFTGVRVGAATAKGLAWALNLPLYSFSSLAAAAADVEGEPLRPRLVLFDARGDRLYAAVFHISRGYLETLMAPRATTVGEVVDRLIPPGALLMGDGARRHRDLLEGAGTSILPAPAGIPTARGLLRLLSLVPAVSPVPDTGRWEPDYLRESGAERLWTTRGEWKGH